MFFTIPNKKFQSIEQLRSTTLLRAYFTVKKYPMHATELILDQYIQQKYKMSLKQACVKLLLGISYYPDKDGNLILLFKNYELDKLARLITYGNGAIPGCNILKIAFQG